MSTVSNGQTVMVQGRVVWTSGSNIFSGKARVDDRTKQPVIDQKTGEQVIEYGFGLAVPKSEIGTVHQAMQTEALGIYPSGQLPPTFAWKFKDGDGVDHNGQPFSSRTGYAGHYVLACTTRIPIKFFVFDRSTNQNVLVNEGIKCGDYLNVQLQVKAHGPIGQGKAGLYLNPMAAQLIGYGEEIVNAPSGNDIFGLQAPPTPQGASVTPIGGSAQLLPSTATTAMPGMAQAPAPQQAAAPEAQAHYGVLPPQHQPQQANTAMPGMAQAVGKAHSVPQPAANPMGAMPGMTQAPAPQAAANPMGAMPGMPGGFPTPGQQ